MSSKIPKSTDGFMRYLRDNLMYELEEADVREIRKMGRRLSRITGVER